VWRDKFPNHALFTTYKYIYIYRAWRICSQTIVGRARCGKRNNRVKTLPADKQAHGWGACIRVDDAPCRDKNVLAVKHARSARRCDGCVVRVMAMAAVVDGVRVFRFCIIIIVVVVIVRKQEAVCLEISGPRVGDSRRSVRRRGVYNDRATRTQERGGRDGGRGQVFGFNRHAAVTEPVVTSHQSQWVRAIAMPRTSVSLSLSLSLLLCAVCDVHAVTAVVSSQPKSFRSANLTVATVLTAREYGKTVLAGHDIVVTVQEYADCAVFRVQARTRGFVSLGFTDSASVDVLLLWVDDETGTGHILVSDTDASKPIYVRFLFAKTRTVVSNI